MINSHVMYKVTTPDKVKNVMKARIFPHIQKDEMKNDTRNDSATSLLDVILLLHAPATMLQMILVVVDISGAHMLSVPSIETYLLVHLEN